MLHYLFLPRIVRDAAEQALEMGLNNDKAHRYQTELTSFKKKIGDYSGYCVTSMGKIRKCPHTPYFIISKCMGG